MIKQRIPCPGEGRSGGHRSIILFRAADRAVFVYGVSKNERDNIGKDELFGFRILANEMLSYTAEEIQTALDKEVLTEVKNDEQDIQE